MIPLIKPDIQFDEVADDIASILASGRLTQGAFVERFEAVVAARVGVPHAVATTSATTALHLALVAAGVGAGDEVILSDFTFPATVNVVLQVGARPVLVDCGLGFALDPDAVRAAVTSRTRALMPVDPFGQPAPMRQLEDLALERDLVLVEDAACALGSAVAGRPCGAWGAAGCFSFHPRKVVTTGEGGMVTTRDAALAERLRRLRTHGAAPGAVGMVFTDAGFNYRLSEIQAALGLAQLRRFDQIIADRRRVAASYDGRLRDLPGVTVPAPVTDEEWSFQSYVVVLDPDIDRDGVIAHLRERGIESTLGTYAVHAQPVMRSFGYAPGDLPRSYANQQQSLTLPLPPRMSDDQVQFVVDALAATIGHRA